MTEDTINHLAATLFHVARHFDLPELATSVSYAELAGKGAAFGEDISLTATTEGDVYASTTVNGVEITVDPDTLSWFVIAGDIRKALSAKEG